MLICLTATSTPFGGCVPRTSNRVPARMRKPERLSRDQVFPTQAAPRPGKARSGRQKIASVAEMNANQMKKRAERNRVKSRGPCRFGVFLVVLVNRCHHEAREIF